MNTLYNQNDLNRILERIEKLTPETQRQWGTMNVAQMLWHCNIALEMAMGIKVVPRLFIGRIVGGLVKNKVLNEKPFGKGSPTDKSFIFPDDVKFEDGKQKTINSIKKFFADGPEKCTKHPHPFFGHLTPAQWGVLQWKHLDHHLRQFGV